MRSAFRALILPAALLGGIGIPTLSDRAQAVDDPAPKTDKAEAIRQAGGDVVRVGYRNRDPKTALAVIERLASLLVGASFVTENNGDAAERFSIQAGPTLPDTPVNQVRPKASLYGGLIGLIVGFALAILQESRDLTLASEDDVRRTLDVPLLGAISLMSVEHDRKTRRRMHATRGGLVS